MRSLRFSSIVILAALAGGGCGDSRSASNSSMAPSPPSIERSTKSKTFADPPSGQIHFTTVDNTGINFRHRTGNSDDRPFPAANGSGLGAIDYDLDGNIDLYFATARTFPLDRPDPLATGNELYRNLGSWSLSNVSRQSGVDHIGYCAGIAVGDFDNDGFSDIYVTCYGPNLLFQNCGDGTFREVGGLAGVNDSKWGTSAAFFDYDGDGDLDLYVCNYGKWSLETNQFCGNRDTHTRIFCNPNSVEPEVHLLYHSNGEGTFTESSEDAGIAGSRGRGQGVVAADVDLDGKIDLFVGNDLQPNFLFQNIGAGKFRNVSEESGAAYDKAGSAHAGMGVDAADLTGDGLPELYVTNFEQEYNTCYLNQGNCVFQDVSEANGLATASRPWVGWGTALVDLDSDGLKDVIVTNGHTDENMSAMGRDTSYEQPALVWRNLGRRFVLVGDAAGDYFRDRHPGRALTIADLDNDGDFDVVVGHQDRAPALLRNDGRDRSELQKQTLTLRLVGRRSCRDAIGSLIRVNSGNLTSYQQVRGGCSYLSAQDSRVIVVCGSGESPAIEIRWPSGVVSNLNRLPVGSSLVIVEPAEDQDIPSISALHSGERAEKQGTLSPH